MKMVIRK